MGVSIRVDLHYQRKDGSVHLVSGVPEGVSDGDWVWLCDGEVCLKAQARQEKGDWFAYPKWSSLKEKKK